MVCGTCSPVTTPTATEARDIAADGPSPCCGGPVPDRADACCARDAQAKSAGRAGCGCTPSASHALVSVSRP